MTDHTDEYLTEVQSLKMKVTQLMDLVIIARSFMLEEDIRHYSQALVFERMGKEMGLWS